MKKPAWNTRDARWALLCALLGGVVLYLEFFKKSAPDEFGLFISGAWLAAAVYYGVRAVRKPGEKTDRPEDTLRDR